MAGASVEEICEQAAFTRGAFYSNFRDKDDLAVALIEDYSQGEIARAEQAVDAIERAVVGSSTTPATVAEFIRRALRLFSSREESPLQYALVFSELSLYAARNPPVRAVFALLDEYIENSVTTIISRGLAATNLRLTVPTAQAIQLLKAAVNGSMVIGRLQRGDEDDDDAIIEPLTEMIMTMTEPID